MTVALITFCDESMVRSACACVSSAMAHGADTAELYTQERLKTTQFYRDNELLLSQPRGCGYWAWKPYIIAEQMAAMRDGDTVIYADAGVEVIDSLSYIVSAMDQPLFLFANQWEHAHWCKADIIAEVWPGSTWADYGKQVQASVIFIRVSDYTRAFVNEWLHWCTYDGGRLVDDSPSTTINYDEFRENRWDQAILSTLAARERIAFHWWAASYGEGSSIYPRNDPQFQDNRHDQAILTTMAAREGIVHHRWAARYNNGTAAQFDYQEGGYADTYPVLFNHHRRRNHEWEGAA